MTGVQRLSDRTRVRLFRVASVALVLGVAVMGFGVFGYYNYLHDEGRQQACDEQFGAGSEWIGNVHNPTGIVCETPSGETKVTQDATTLPMSWGTFTSYVGEVSDAIGGLVP